ncbi:hypothetical protein EC957_003785 [Mortierella hygrophila]|uniref:Uncharacterized protein n=1 Tax=Mortierella hygrophila TaxID=979708 RepID=A0A9P6K7C8_9FUNG|nr:hypothetical protein EC957_003785 [Mortierella hygrophila]
MVLSFRSIFQSESQRQVEAEARNIGLAHSIRDLITGSNHETHVDSYQKKKAVKALQKAKPAEVNDLINILKAMPDPTVVEFKEIHSREASRHHHPPAPISPAPAPAPEPQEPKPSTGDATTTPPATTEPADDKEGGGSSKDKDGEEEEVEAVKAPSSWWAVSFASLKATLISGPAVGEPSITTTTTTVTTITMTAEEVKKAAAEAEAAEAAEIEEAKAKAAEQEAVATAADVVVESTAVKKDKEVVTATATAKATGTGTNKNIGTITSSTIVANIKTTADKTTLVSTLNSIKKQIVALTKTPPIDVISAYTYWWGYEIYVPHKCMNKLQRVSNTSQIFFGFLSGAVAGMPGLAALVPLSRIISAWVGFQWAIIHAEDLGKGVVLSATWVLPVALAPRSWDRPGTE